MNQIPIFKLLCNCLEPVDNTIDISNFITGNDFSWDLVINVANRHRLLPAFYHGLKQKGILDTLPLKIHDTLLLYYQVNKERNTRIKKQCCHIIQQFNSVGIEPLLIKGAEHLFSDLYHDPAVRMMIDIDLLVPKDQMMSAVNVLKKYGYRHMHEHQQENHHHYPAMARTGDVASIEVHEHIVKMEYTHLLSTQDVWDRAVSISHHSIKFQIPNAMHNIMLNITHNALSSLSKPYASFGDIKLFQIYDLVLMNRHYGNNVDWQAIKNAFYSKNCGSAFNTYLTIIKNLFPTSATTNNIYSGIPSTLAWYNFYCQNRFPKFNVAFFHMMCLINFLFNSQKRSALLNRLKNRRNYRLYVDYLRHISQFPKSNSHVEYERQ